MRFGALWMACPAPVPIASIKFVDGVGVWIVPVYGVPCTRHVMFTMVRGMLNSLAVQWMVVCHVVIVSSGLHVLLLAFVLVLLPHQPFPEHFGVVDAASPPQQGFGRIGILLSAI